MECSAATEAISPVLTIETHAPEQTTALGTRLGAGLRAGDVILLRGDLGAGKTHFARGIAAGLGIPGPIPSPTFTLVYEYEGVNAAGQRVPLAHIDLYRLNEGGELDSVGLDEYVGGGWAAVIEWPERAVNENFVPPAYLDIALDYVDERTRRLTATGHGAASRLLDLLAARGSDA
jgi:tRNA threonylcarbamoyladenosine biosynthesis protein TsaE